MRAGEEVNHYVALGRREQGEEEFFSTAADVVRDLESQLPRLRGKPAALEIGCGPGMPAGNSRSGLTIRRSLPTAAQHGIPHGILPHIGCYTITRGCME